ncbi:ATP-binding protein [Methylobacterium soli]|uniref:ATP-binding protein n=1 Tax=Methylobacterium soli TaxID=553447 RepID=A0A6L3SVZ4_9HYPH|nr:ATP-binding protein [Methylobacterium soli]KAB1075949.1 hypothetical protein F6X53_24280 [Methylobacterium soli]GJE45029.1 DNA mismatch repair protein MutL [Methylobacterium soli]
MAILELKAQHDALQKIATTRDPLKALAEFVWNALDADATEISVDFARNALGGLDGILIRDNGTGITRDRALADYENLGASWKRSSQRTRLNRVLHGKEGQGRLRFFSVAQRASWRSVYADSGALKKLSIEIQAASLHKSEVTQLELGEDDTHTGTCVELSPLKDTFDWLSSEEAVMDFTAIFAPYILQYPGVVLSYDGQVLDPSATITHTREFELRSIIGPTRTIRDLSIKVIEWRHSVGGRKIHLGGQSGVVLGSLPANVTAPGFEFSAYAYSPFFQEMADANLLELDGLNDQDYTKVIEHVRDVLSDHFRSRQAEKSGELIQELKNAGVYPYEGDPKDEVERRERQVVDIAIHAVTSYSRDFKRAENSLKRITLGLLREAVRHNPESMHNILHHVFNLPKNRQDEFSNLLQKTNLGNIISASTLISDRVVALQVLKSIVFDPKHRHSVKERGELDVLVQANTWIFGENFHITLAETGLSRIMQRVSEELSGKKSKKPSLRKPDGSIGRVDSFLGRVVPHQQQRHREFLLIELKRPSLKIGRKEADQLEDYVNAIRTQPDFYNTSTFWNFYLVTGDYDDAVRERITQKDRPEGILLEKPTHIVWVKTWSELIRECEARLHFIAEKLQIEVTTEEIEERIAQLKASIMREDPRMLNGSSSDTSESEPESLFDRASSISPARIPGGLAANRSE